MDTAIDLGITSIEHAKAPWPVVLKDELKREHDALVFKSDKDEEKAAFKARIGKLGLESICPSRLEELISEMVKKNVFLCPTLDAFVQMDAAPTPHDNSSEDYDSKQKKPNPLKEGSFYFTREMARGGVKMLVGQDNDKPAGTFREMKHMKDCGVAEAEVIKGATIYPAEWLGVQDRLGSIAAGKQANILLVSKNPLENIENIQSTFLVVQNGRIAETQ
jgi:imidazolonepropionase-like amidohydrolase